MAALVTLLRRRIAIKLALTLVGFVGVILAVAGLYFGRALESLAVESLEARLDTAGRLLHDRARGLLAGGASPADVHAFVVAAARTTGARVTLIARDGRVVGESELPVEALPGVENHGERPEVQQALAGDPGHDLRRSATIQAPLLYVARPVRDAGRVIGVIRLAVPLADVTSAYAAIHRVMVAGGLIAMVAALAIGLFVARRVVRPVVEMQAIAGRMSEGDFAIHAPVRSPDEIGSLGRALNALARSLRDKIRDLEGEKARVTAILDGMVEGVIAVDGHDAIVLLNERARAMFGLLTHGTPQRPFLEVIRNADLHDVLRQSRADEGVIRRELWLSGPVPRSLQANAVRFHLGRGELGVVMVLHDVTELRRLEQVRTEFVANVSHELRTPLTAIQGYLETLLGGALEEREHARAFLEIVFRHTERLGRLLNDLTDLSNIELGRVSLKLEETSLGEVVDSVLTIMQPRAESGTVALTAEVPVALPAVSADRDRLAQILINLVDNAVKYTPAGGRVTVRARSVDEPAGAGEPAMVEVAIADTGVGIPRRDLPRLTERFYRVDRARSRELGGTGLGLAIVKHLVLAHGGQLTIDSEVGQGTTVTFTLPGRPQGAPAATGRITT